MTRARPRVLITASLPASSLDRVAAIPRRRLLAQAAGKAGTITRLTDRIDQEFLDAAGPQLSVVVNCGGDFRNIDLNACTCRGVLAANAPDALADSAADMTFALMMGAAGHASGDERQHTRDIRQQTLGIVGFGRMGQALARRACRSGMIVVYHDTRMVAADIGGGPGAQYRDLEDLLREADFVSLSTGLSEGSGHLINAERLAMMKPTAVLVNTSGGHIVDEQALADVLNGGRLLAAGIDVARKARIHPGLLACENALVVRHLGGLTMPAPEAMAHLAVDNLLAGLQGERPPSLVNPQAWLQRSFQARRRRLVAGSAQENARRSGSADPGATVR